MERLKVIDYYDFYRLETGLEMFAHSMFIPPLPREISSFCQGFVQFYLLFSIDER